MLTELELAIVEDNRGKIWRMIFADPGVVNRRNEKDITPLCMAVSRGTPEVVELLLQWGAEIDAYSSRYKSTATMTAVTRRRADTLEVLLKHNVDVNKPDGDGTTPKEMAHSLNYPDIERLLRTAMESKKACEGIMLIRQLRSL